MELKSRFRNESMIFFYQITVAYRFFCAFGVDIGLGNSVLTERYTITYTDGYTVAFLCRQTINRHTTFLVQESRVENNLNHIHHLNVDTRSKCVVIFLELTSSYIFYACLL